MMLDDANHTDDDFGLPPPPCLLEETHRNGFCTQCGAPGDLCWWGELEDADGR